MRHPLPTSLGSPAAPQPPGRGRSEGGWGGGWGPGGEDRLPLRRWRASGTTSEVLAGAPPARRTAREAMR